MLRLEGNKAKPDNGLQLHWAMCGGREVKIEFICALDVSRLNAVSEQPPCLPQSTAAS